MKKVLAIILTLILAIGMLTVTAFAKDYTEFNITFDEKDGEKVNETKITVLASVGDGAMVDRTSEFTMEGVEWTKYVSAPEEGKTADDYDYVDEELKIYGMLCTDEDVFESENYSYFLRISRLYAQEDDSFDRNIKINGKGIDELNGICYNTGNEFFIKTVTNGFKGTPTEETEPTPINIEPDTEPIIESEDVLEEAAEEKCKVCGICPIQPLGICLFIWIAIILLAIIFIVIVVSVAKKKNGKNK